MAEPRKIKGRRGLDRPVPSVWKPRARCQRKRVVAPPAEFIRERQAHFAEVDAFELLEESPSPKPKQGSSCSFEDGGRLVRAPLEVVPEEVFLSPEEFLTAALRTPPVRGVLRPQDGESLLEKFESLSISKSTAPSVSIIDELLRDSAQERLVSLGEAFSEFCDLKTVVKIGEGTYGEAFKANGYVFKVVPMDGSFKVNGEPQKSSGDIYSEVLLSNTLNKLRDRDSSFYCTSFIETKGTRVCRGKYDKDLIRAWKEWDAKHNSENDEPMAFPDEQLYAVFVLTDGGTDLESSEPLTFKEAKSLLLQVVLSLAVAEQAYGFEHRDLHWGNIVLSRNSQEQLDFRFNTKNFSMTPNGLIVSIIDFTLSRIDTGNQVIFCDLSDPSWFEGPEGDVQADTYRRMRDATNGNWEGRFPKTNSVWIHYVAEIIRAEKSSRISPKHKRALAAFAKRCLQLSSATDLVTDKLFDKMCKQV